MALSVEMAEWSHYRQWLHNSLADYVSSTSDFPCRLESNQSCITLLGGGMINHNSDFLILTIIAWQNAVTGPVALSSSVSPVGRFSPTASTIWSISFDQRVSY